MTSHTAQQTAIIDHVAQKQNESLIVSARAGSGKTYTIVKAAFGIKPGHLSVAVAFNKKIATELQERLPQHVTASTLNSIGHRAWMSALNGVRIQLDADKMFRLTKNLFPQDVDDPDGEEFSAVLALGRAAKSVGIVPKGAPMGKIGIVPDDGDSWEDLAWQKDISLSEVTISITRSILLASIKEAYAGTIDFDDQIYMSVLFGGRFTRYHTVIVDEAQDLSLLNHLMLKKMVGTRLIAVGDPFQAIYGFRGADSDSMENLRDLMGIPLENVLGLTESFRCPQVVASRQTTWVPDFVAHSSCKPGKVSDWRSQPSGWSLDDVPDHGVVICRNNAPLMQVAFALIKSRRPVQILGRDIGANLSKLLLKIGNKDRSRDLNEMPSMIDAWRQDELKKAEGKESRHGTIHDKADSLAILCEASGAKTLGEACDFILGLFSDIMRPGVTLSSGHRSKGLEWDWVMHLDSFRVPSRFARKAAENGNQAPLRQELNLRYVIETRTKDDLIIADLEGCQEIGATA